MHPGRPVVRPYSSSILLLSYVAKQPHQPLIRASVGGIEQVIHLESCTPDSLNVNGQIGTYWSVLVRISLYQYQQVQDFPDWYKPVQDGTRQYQTSLFGTRWYQQVQV